MASTDAPVLRWPVLGADEVGPNAADLFDRTNKLADPTVECRLVRGQGRLQTFRFAS
jgi:hypothetical protein